VKNEVGALATSIIYEPKAISIAEFGIKRAKKSGPKTAFSKSVLRKLNQL
jgi:hypothetical protein